MTHPTRRPIRGVLPVFQTPFTLIFRLILPPCNGRLNGSTAKAPMALLWAWSRKRCACLVKNGKHWPKPPVVLAVIKASWIIRCKASHPYGGALREAGRSCGRRCGHGDSADLWRWAKTICAATTPRLSKRSTFRWSCRMPVAMWAGRCRLPCRRGCLTSMATAGLLGRRPRPSGRAGSMRCDRRAGASSGRHGRYCASGQLPPWHCRHHFFRADLIDGLSRCGRPWWPVMSNGSINCRCPSLP